jgi:hypothetical protein
VRRDVRRRFGLIAVPVAIALLALVVLVVLLWAPRSPAPPEPPPRAVLATPTNLPRGPIRGPGAPTAQAGGPTGAGSAIEPVDPHDTPTVPPPLPSARFAYPPGSQPLTEGVHPGTQPKEEDPVDAEKGIRCIFGPRVAIVHPPDPLVIDLEVQNRLGADQPVGNPVARFRTEGADPKAGPWFAAPFADDGSGRDLGAGDLRYTATFQPTADQSAVLLHSGVHLFVEVAFEAPENLGARKYVTTMQYSREPDASLDGKYTERVEQGSLVISAGVTAKAAADYRLIGSLYAGDTAIAFAQKSVHLEAGDGAIPLLFFGKILHDRGIDGPYVLRYVMLFQHAGADEIASDTVDPAYTTQPYSARSFSDAPYVPPAPTFEVVDQNSPSQQGKPPPLFSEKDREAMRGTTAPIRADPTSGPAQPIPTGTK